MGTPWRAVAYEDTLECMRYTVAETHDFNSDTFWAGFAAQVVLRKVNVFQSPEQIQFVVDSQICPCYRMAM